MSQSHQEKKTPARERISAERRRQQQKAKRTRQLTVAGAVIGVLVLAVVIGLIIQSQRAQETKPFAAPKNMTNNLAVPVGRAEAPATLTVYEDFRCPACALFERTFGPTIGDLVAQGKLRVDYHTVRLIDANLGGQGSLRAANAAACAQDEGRFAAYHDVLFAHQPPETSDGFTNQRLLELAGQVPGLKTPAFEQCVANGTYDPWVTRITEAFFKARFTGTPTILLNGTNLSSGAQTATSPLASPAAFRKAVEDTIAGKPSSAPIP